MKQDTPQSWKEAITTLPPEGMDTTDCPDPEQVWSAVRGDLPPDEFGDIADHAATCPLCSLAWQLGEKGSDAIGRPEVPRAGKPWRAWYGLAAAAVLVMAAALVMQFRGAEIGPVTSPPEYRAPVEETVMSSLPEDAVLSREDCTLRWSGPDGALFNIQIASAGYEILYRETGLTGTMFTIPATVIETIPPGGAILWQVEAVLPDGTTQSSKTFQVTLE
jgi:hypothetical protein